MLEGGGIGGLVFDSSGVVGRGLVSNKALICSTCIPRRSAQDSSCLNKLSPCLNYLNGTEDPPDSCCEPLKSVIESDAECLCNLVSNRGTRR
ncbi:hypothetical protein JHK85_003544 [Glycine max]|nr:hypothetical protein JHK85_003544 [Glycine max]